MINEEQKIIPARLKEARLVRGLSIGELAIRVGLSKQAISQYELGENEPKSSTMMGIIRELDFPKSFFYKTYEEHIIGNTFFRASAAATKKNKEIQYNKSRLAGYIYDYLQKYIEFPELNLPDLSLFDQTDWDDDSIELLAENVRQFWGLGENPINNIVNLMERNGIAVFSIDMESLKVDAFCQSRKGRPYIFLGNDKESAARRQFDAAHEIGHRLMHNHIHNQDILSREEFKIIEHQANRFASAFLLPAEAFAKTVTSTKLIHFIELKKYWKVSIAAMLYRAQELGIIDQSRYTSLMKQMSIHKMRSKEPLDDVIPVPKPILLNKGIKMLLHDNFKNELQIINESGVPGEFIEMLCTMDKGSLKLKEIEPTLRLIVSNKKGS
ncbi:ImmA/IrrE family metallo-endopeptidase [Paenibacillus timonensis]|nr:XRE family transcriptional regulator [Paenibacillus timonensis]MUG86903.1 ImmA/IrrE family metallo-endopeptidase [Paenibacillus timonensis]